MAVDTRDKRSSAINVGSPWRGMLPNADGTVSDLDRPHIMFLYRLAASAPAAAVVVVTTNRNLVIGLGPMSKPSAHPHPLFSRLNS